MGSGAGEEEVFEYSRADAIGFGVEAVLDGLAALIADGQTIAATAPGDHPVDNERHPLQADQTPTGDEGAPQHAIPERPRPWYGRLLSDRWFWLAVGAAALIGIGYLAQALR